ncbi:g8469 [Coccomyxa viridis]|uniref:G8469 protein n=1 Tax=Coccomyxa viridis TaxID=1274662 RepID=A0ABP1G2U0_9CHLO
MADAAKEGWGDALPGPVPDSQDEEAMGTKRPLQQSFAPVTQKGRKRKRPNTPAKPLSHQDIREVGLKDDEKITLALAERDPEHAMKMAKNLIRAFRVRLKKMEQ